MTVTAPADRRFLRARVKPGRRHGAWYARLRAVRVTVVVCLLVTASYGLVRLVWTSGMFSVSRVTVRGNTWLASGEVLALVDGLKGENLLSTSLLEWRRRLLASSWVQDATLRRVLPGTIDITIVERRPIGIGRVGGALYLVDERGTVIDEYGPRYADFDLPVIDGLTGTAAGSTGDADLQRAALAARLLGALKLKPDLARRVSQVDVSDPRNAVVVLDTDAVMIRLGDDQFVERLQKYIEIAPALRERVPDMEYVDLRFGERVPVGAARPEAVTAGAAPRGSRAQPPSGG
jgi:cell division protein FtsQ